jgi:hypothetical protein
MLNPGPYPTFDNILRIALVVLKLYPEIDIQPPGVALSLPLDDLPTNVDRHRKMMDPVEDYRFLDIERPREYPFLMKGGADSDLNGRDFRVARKA